MLQHDSDPHYALSQMSDAEIVALLRQSAGYMILELARRGRLTLAVDDAAVDRGDASKTLRVDYSARVR